MADVFISYARADRERIEQMAAGLEAQGLSVWWDSSAQGGGPPEREADSHLADAACVVVGWSGASVNRRWVRNHARHGVGRDALVQVLLTNVVPPVEFRDLHTEDLTRWTGDTSDPQWQKFVSAVRTKAGPQDTAAPSKSKSKSKKARAAKDKKSSSGGLFTWIAVLGLIGLGVAGYLYGTGQL